MMDHKIECAGWRQESCDDGPGIRSVLFLQGCQKNCPNCHNASINKHGEGNWFSVAALVKKIGQACSNKKLTISGGEPLEQQQALLNLLRLLKQNHFEICLYTGWNLQDVPENIVHYVDYLKTGTFKEYLQSADLQYVGSANQKMYRIYPNGVLKEL